MPVEPERSSGRSVVALAAVLAVLALLPSRAIASGFADYQPTTVDPAISRPATKHCTVQLLRDHGFSGFDPVRTSFAPPADCPGPWSKVVLDVDTHVKGVQYDRIGMLWLGRDEILRFSTAEPTASGIRYHFEKDVTDYSPLMRSPQAVTSLLGNVVNKEYTGIIYMTATLTFYEPGPHAPAAPVADDIIAIDGSKADIPSGDGELSKTLTSLPTNIIGATLDLYATNHGCDEFWYSNQPDAFAAAHKSDGLCGGNAYREIDVSIDDRLADIVFPFPYIWTGGINPLLWRPLSAIHTLDVPAYQVDLDPWAGVLSDGKPHTIRLSVLDDRGSWPMDANLLLWTDAHRTHTGGAIVIDDIPASAALSSAQRPIDGGTRFWLTASRHLRIGGYVETSSGTIWHGVDTRMTFSNLQFVNLATGEGDATQSTTIERTTFVGDMHGARSSAVRMSYPLIANATYPPPRKMKPYTLVIEAEVHQGLHVRGPAGVCNATADATAVLKRIKPHVDAVAEGMTSERNACSGALGDFANAKSAKNGSPQP